MKFLFVAVLFWSAHAHAVRTADCPTTLEAKFSDFKFHLSFERDSENDSSCVVDCYNEEGMALAQKELETAKQIEGTLKLAYKLTGVCAYSGQFNGKPFTAELRGTFNEGSVNKAQIVATWDGVAIYSTLASMSPDKIELLGSTSIIYYIGEYCSYGDCVVDHIHLGTAAASELKVVK